jgi:hypothetical protein
LNEIKEGDIEQIRAFSLLKFFVSRSEFKVAFASRGVMESKQFSILYFHLAYFG